MGTPSICVAGKIIDPLVAWIGQEGAGACHRRDVG
jgi:hypothetical protein